MLGSNFVKFMSILKRQVSSSSIFVFHCKFEAHTFSTLDKRILSKFQFWHFRVLWWKFAKFLMSFSKQKVSFSSNFASLFNVMKDISSALFLAQRIYTLLKRSPLKWIFFRFSSAQVKICQIPYVKFWKNDKSIPLQILYPSTVSWKITPL